MTLSNESGVFIAKAIRITWDFEYDMGRRRWKISSKQGLSQRNIMVNLIFLLSAIIVINQAIGRPKADNERAYAVSHNAS